MAERADDSAIILYSQCPRKLDPQPFLKLGINPVSTRFALAAEGQSMDALSRRFEIRITKIILKKSRGQLHR